MDAVGVNENKTLKKQKENVQTFTIIKHNL